MNNIFSPIKKYISLFICWFLGIYITFFVMCFYAHVNESNIIANRADALITQINYAKSNLDKVSSLGKVSSVQNMVRKTKPSFLEPHTIIWSLIGKREPYKLINKLLGNVIENSKPELALTDLYQVDLEAADLSNANMHGVKLNKANLSGANLTGANLINAKLSLANLRRASLFNANLYKADFSNSILNGANLEHSTGITCAQIKSAVINEMTRFPSYISLKGSTDSVFKCINSRAKKGMNLSRINMVNSFIVGADFSKSNLSHANFLNSSLTYSNFNSANLNKTNLKGASLKYGTFSGAKFTGADLRGANLNRALGITCEQIKSAVIDDNTRLPDYILLVRPINTSFKCVNFLKGEGLDLNGISLKNLFLRDADFRKSNLSHANFLNADLMFSRFNSANLSHANFLNADLMFSRFNSANLSHANFLNIDLRLSDFNSANLNKTNLRGANLDRALGITCEQIKSAIIDDNTRLPDYILLVRPINKCINFVKGEELDLNGMSLKSFFLSGADFSRSNFFLRGADFSKSNLSYANFLNADLAYSNFNSANLNKTNLKGASLKYGTFSGAKFTGADLRGANLNRALGITCEQIKSAVIDGSTRLPDYFSLKCENILNEN